MNLQLPPNHSHYLIAFSGGLDSSALLHLMAKLRQDQPQLKLRTVHIHHGLNPKADDWAAHCTQVCEQLSIPLIIQKVQISSSSNVEQQARLARYQAISHIKLAEEIVVTAHHLQDQSETFLLALKRGSGVKGLSSMQRESTLFGMKILRPLLDYSRAQLEDYARQQNLRWIEDDSNANNRYDRNFLRNQILPELRARWDYVDRNIARSAQHCFEQQQLVNELLAPEFAQNFNQTDRTFSVQNFAQYSDLKAKALLRMWLEQLAQAMPSAVQLEEILRNLIFAPSDRNPEFQLGDKMLRRYQQKLYLTDIFQSVSGFEAELKLNEKLELPDNLGWLMLQKNSQNFTAVWENGERKIEQILPLTEQPIAVKFGYSDKVKLRPNEVNRDIKKIWQGLQLPPWLRSRIPLIFYGERLQAAVGYFSVQD